jgi:hypothetical protein
MTTVRPATGGTSGTPPTVVKPPTGGNPQAETKTERYLRHIRNVLVALFVVLVVSGLASGIAYAAVAAHAHAVQEQADCYNSGGNWINGQCL